jgi:hypothetical protein
MLDRLRNNDSGTKCYLALHRLSIKGLNDAFSSLFARQTIERAATICRPTSGVPVNAAAIVFKPRNLDPDLA